LDYFLLFIIFFGDMTEEGVFIRHNGSLPEMDNARQSFKKFWIWI